MSDAGPNESDYYAEFRSCHLMIWTLLAKINTDVLMDIHLSVSPVQWFTFNIVHSYRKLRFVESITDVTSYK